MSNDALVPLKPKIKCVCLPSKHVHAWGFNLLWISDIRRTWREGIVPYLMNNALLANRRCRMIDRPLPGPKVTCRHFRRHFSRDVFSNDYCTWLLYIFLGINACLCHTFRTYDGMFCISNLQHKTTSLLPNNKLSCAAYITSWIRMKWFNTLRPKQNSPISQTTFSSASPWMKMYEFHLRFHWNLFLRFELVIF